MNKGFKYQMKGLKPKSSGMVTLTSLLTFLMFSCKSSLEVEVKKGAELPSASSQLCTSTIANSETAKNPAETSAAITPQKSPVVDISPDL